MLCIISSVSTDVLRTFLNNYFALEIYGFIRIKQHVHAKSE